MLQGTTHIAHCAMGKDFVQDRKHLSMKSVNSLWISRKIKLLSNNYSWFPVQKFYQNTKIRPRFDQELSLGLVSWPGMTRQVTSWSCQVRNLIIIDLLFFLYNKPHTYSYVWISLSTSFSILCFSNLPILGTLTHHMQPDTHLLIHTNTYRMSVSAWKEKRKVCLTVPYAASLILSHTLTFRFVYIPSIFSFLYTMLCTSIAYPMLA